MRSPVRARLAGAAELAAVAAGYLAGLVTLWLGLRQRTVFPEDLEWIAGEVLGSPLRLTQHLVLHRLGLPLFQDDLTAYFIPGVALHLAAAAGVHLLFVLTFSALCPGARTPAAVRAGGAAAGLLFLLGQPAVVVYPSALSYQLVTVASVAALCCAVLHLRSGRARWWAGLLLCYGAALFSHSYAVGLPLLVLALEVARVRARTPGEDSPTLLRWLMPRAPLRYAALALPLALAALRVGLAAPRIEASLSTYRAQEVGPWLLLYHARYLTEVLIRFGQDAFGWASLAQLHRAGPDLSAVDIAALVVWVAVGALGLAQLLRRGTLPGLAGFVLLFFVGWSGLCLVQTYLTSDYFAQWWRFYYNAAGLAVALACGALRLAAGAARLVRAPEGAAAWAVTVLLAATCLATRPARSVHPMEWARKTPEYAAVPARADAGGRSLRQQRPRGVLAGADLRGADMFRADLQRMNLAGARMAGASLLLADLLQADLTGADLTGALLVHARLAGASMVRARLRAANLEGATLTAARLDRAKLSRAHLAWAVLEDAGLSRADLRRANLRGARLSRADLRGADLRGAHLEGADLRDADLRQADLRGARLGDTRFERARLQGARLCTGRPAVRGHLGTPRLERCEPVSHQ